MKFGIQMGYGLQQASIDLTRKWGGGAVVVTPRVFRFQNGVPIESSIIKYCKRISKYASEVFFDPMLYIGKDQIRQVANAKYSQRVNGTNADGYLNAIPEILALNEECNTSATILPSWTIGVCDNEWALYQERSSHVAKQQNAERRVFVTLSLSSDLLKQVETIDWIAENSDRWHSDGAFLALEHPNNDYLTHEPLWLLNVLCLIASLKRTGKEVMIGYGSHQLLFSALAKCDYLCCGNFLNVRRFHTEDFRQSREEARGHRATWYYVPQALSEFKVPSLDLAHAMGVLQSLKPPYEDTYANMLFAGAIPSSTAYNEGMSFKHYLNSLYWQSEQLTLRDYDETFYACQSLIRTAETLVDGLRQVGVHDRDRNFSQASQACSQAISAFNTKMGFVMRNAWHEL